MELSAPRSTTKSPKASVFQLDGFQALAQCSHRAFVGFILNGGKRNEFIMEIGDRFGPYLFMMCVPQLMGDEDVRVLLYFIPYRVVFTDVQDVAPGDCDSSVSCIVPLEVFLNLPERDAYYSGLSEQDLLKLFPHATSCLNSPSFDSDANAALQRATSIHTLFHDGDCEVASAKLTVQENSYASTPSGSRKSSRSTARLVDTSNILEHPRLRVPVLPVIHTPTATYKDKLKAKRAAKRAEKRADATGKKADQVKAGMETKALLKAQRDAERKAKKDSAKAPTVSAPQSHTNHDVSSEIADFAQRLHQANEMTSQKQSELAAAKKEVALLKKKCAEQESQSRNRKNPEFADPHRTTTTSTTSPLPLLNTNFMGAGVQYLPAAHAGAQYPPAAPAIAQHPHPAPTVAQHPPPAPAAAQHPPPAPAIAQHPPPAPAVAQHPPPAPAVAQHPLPAPAAAQHPPPAPAGALYASAVPAGAMYAPPAPAGAQYTPAGALYAPAGPVGVSYVQPGFHSSLGGVGLLTVEQYNQILHTNMQVFQEMHHGFSATQYFSNGFKR